MIILPRQARDKRRKLSPKYGFLAGDAASMVEAAAVGGGDDEEDDGGGGGGGGAPPPAIAAPVVGSRGGPDSDGEEVAI